MLSKLCFLVSGKFSSTLGPELIYFRRRSAESFIKIICTKLVQHIIIDCKTLQTNRGAPIAPVPCSMWVKMEDRPESSDLVDPFREGKAWITSLSLAAAAHQHQLY
ncbi:unnamed protein product [Lota lota]